MFNCVLNCLKNGALGLGILALLGLAGCVVAAILLAPAGGVGAAILVPCFIAVGIGAIAGGLMGCIIACL